MLKLSDLKSPKGAHKKRKVVGRGPGSGHGKTSCRGSKGQTSRTGKGKRPGFEGGQMPLIRRIPKRGFTNRFKQEFQVVNLQNLNKYKEDSTITPKELFAQGIIKKLDIPVKILGKGKIKKRIIVKAHKFSQSAQRAIEEVGGKVELVNA